MKSYFPFKHFFLELSLSVIIAGILSFFTKNFTFWFIAYLIFLLIWHHYGEFVLLQSLQPEKKSRKNKRSHFYDYIPQTLAYHKISTNKERIKTLRLISKVNKNIQFLPDAIILCKTGGEIVWCNQLAQGLFDFSWDKKLHKNIFNIIFYPEFKQYLHKKKRTRPLVLFTHQQQYIELSLNHYDQQTYLIVAKNITEFIRLLHSRQTFLSNMNHELRTPLAVIQGYIEILEAELQSPAFDREICHKAIATMQQQSHRMGNLLQQLSTLAKIEHSNNTEHYFFNASEQILALQCDTDILSSCQQIIFDIEENILIKGDASQMQSAISNLIYNAIRHAGEQVTITVRWQLCAKGAKFSVKDNGIGIAPKHLPHLTERFYRVDKSRSAQTGGSGLGLAIVKHALEQHQSFLDIHSEQGKGSEFSFVIPNALVKLGA